MVPFASTLPRLTEFRGTARTPPRYRAQVAALMVVAACALVLPQRSTLADDRDNCLYCHRFPGLSRLDIDTNQVRLFFVDPQYNHDQLGPHARLSCTDCHPREQVAVVPHHAVTPVDCTRQCHLSAPNAPERRFSHGNIARMLEQSAHASEVFSALEFTGGPMLAADQSKCLYCHDEPVFSTPPGDVFSVRGGSEKLTDRCDVCHTNQIPIDTTYHLRHVAARLAPARPMLELAQACAICHGDPKVLAKHELPNSVASFVRSFHGKAALLGDRETAGCVDCHVAAGQNAHLMLGPTHAQSSVSPANVADSCRSIACHPGADPRFSAAAVHLDIPTTSGSIEFGLALAFIVLTIISFGPSAAIVLLELAQIVVGRHHEASHRVRELAERLAQTPEGRTRLMRFTPRQRMQHWVLTLLFVLLCLTGFPLKFADQAWAGAIIDAFGGLSVARLTHHWAGIILVIGFAAHLADILVGVVRRARQRDPSGKALGLARSLFALPLVVTPEDVRRAGQLLGYLLGLRRERPMFGRFTATEKFEYFGVMWGTTLLGLTGLMLWGEQIASHIFGGRVFNLALIIHTYEAFLAGIHVGILHIYNVVLNPTVAPLSLATITGATPPAKLAEENAEFVLDAVEEMAPADTEEEAGE